jgi:hypothetical protein
VNWDFKGSFGNIQFQRNNLSIQQAEITSMVSRSCSGAGSGSGANARTEANARLQSVTGNRNWVARNVSWLKSLLRIILGIVWLIDGYLKFSPGLVDSFPALIKSEGQPSWLQPWFNFWSSVTSANGAPFVYSIGTLELALGAALVFGFMRKIGLQRNGSQLIDMGDSRRLRRTIRPSIY